MRHTFNKIAVSLVAILFPFTAFAAPALTSRLEGAGSSAGFSQGTTIFTVISTIINVALGLLGMIFLVLTIYAGFMWMTAGGDEGKVETAKHTLTRAVIGLVIVLSSYAIANFVVPQVYCATKPSAQGCPNGLMAPTSL